MADGADDTSPPLRPNSFLYALRHHLAEATERDRRDALSGAATWTLFVFRALFDAAKDCGMMASASKDVERTSQAARWQRREYLFDVTWYRGEGGPWEIPSVLLEHENLWHRDAFLADFWKLLLGLAPLRVMIGYAANASLRDSWVDAINEMLSVDANNGFRPPADVDDLILIGHKGMLPTGYAVYQRDGRVFVRVAETLDGFAMPDPRDAAPWKVYLSRLQAQTRERVGLETSRIEKAGIIDAHGAVVSGSLPSDMAEGSRSSVTTG